MEKELSEFKTGEKEWLKNINIVPSFGEETRKSTNAETESKNEILSTMEISSVEGICAPFDLSDKTREERQEDILPKKYKSLPRDVPEGKIQTGVPFQTLEQSMITEASMEKELNNKEVGSFKTDEKESLKKSEIVPNFEENLQKEMTIAVTQRKIDVLSTVERHSPVERIGVPLSLLDETREEKRSEDLLPKKDTSFPRNVPERKILQIQEQSITAVSLEKELYPEEVMPFKTEGKDSPKINEIPPRFEENVLHQWKKEASAMERIHPDDGTGAHLNLLDKIAEEHICDDLFPKKEKYVPRDIPERKREAGIFFQKEEVSLEKEYPTIAFQNEGIDIPEIVAVVPKFEDGTVQKQEVADKEQLLRKETASPSNELLIADKKDISEVGFVSYTEMPNESYEMIQKKVKLSPESNEIPTKTGEEKTLQLKNGEILTR